jgi:3-carboxy-cis,cis-muconate cycloisomerase
VAELLASELELPLPDLPWHAERDRIAQVAAALGIAAGAMAKIANDLVLLAQTEVGEAAEATAPGKGGSSAMPQKRNPVDAMEALAGARLATATVPVILQAMTNEHERAVGGWQAEWVAIPDLFRYTAGAVEHVRSAVDGIQIDPERMRANLDLGGGLLMAEALTVALARHWGRPEAQRVVQAVCTRASAAHITLRQAAHENAQIRAVLAPNAIAEALDPANYLGSADVLTDRALAAYRDVQQHNTLP